MVFFSPRWFFRVRKQRLAGEKLWILYLSPYDVEFWPLYAMDTAGWLVRAFGEDGSSSVVTSIFWLESRAGDHDSALPDTRTRYWRAQMRLPSRGRLSPLKIQAGSQHRQRSARCSRGSCPNT